MKDKWPVLHGSDPMRYRFEPSESEGADFIIERAMAGSPGAPLWLVGLGAARIVFDSALPFVLFDAGTYLRVSMKETETKVRPC
jgi:hypothetical protein